MALCRLLPLKSSLPIYRLRFPTATVRLRSSMCSNSDSDKPSQLKKDAVAEEEKEMTVEPFIKDSRSTKTKPGLYSKATFIRNEDGESWHILKNVIHILKDKMLGTNRPQNYHNSDASTPSEDPTASMVIASKNVSDQGSGELKYSELTATLQNAVILNNKDMSVNHGTSGTARYTSSDEMVNATTSEVNQMLNFSHSPESEDEDAFNTVMSTAIASQSSGEKYCEGATRTNDSKLVDQETGCMKSDEVSSIVLLDLNEDLISNSENSSSLQPRTVVEESRVEEDIAASRLDSTECRKFEENEMVINLVSQRGAVSTVYGGSKKTIRLTDVFREQKSDQTSTMAENEQTKPEEALSTLLLNVARNGDLQFQHLSPSYNLLQGGASTDLENVKLDFPLTGRDYHPPEYENIRSEGGEMSSPSNGARKIFDSKGCDVKSVNDQIAEVTLKIRSLISTHRPFEHSNEPCKMDAEKLFDIKSLIDVIRLQEDVTNNNSSTGLIQEDSSNANSQRFGQNDRLTSSEFTMAKSRAKDEETGDLDFRSLGCTDLKTSMEIPISTKNFTKNSDRKKLNNTLLAGDESNENKVLVRFLHKYVTETDILQSFEKCGKILKVEISDVGGPWFKIAYIYFKTREGLQNALKESGKIVNNGDKVVQNAVVTVESTTLMEKMTGKIPFPSLIYDPDVSAALIKNPSRTVKIQPLTCDINSHHILEAMAFCESNVSGYFLGSSNSVAFVEFETEIGKERALAKHSINVLGRQLTVLRIDAPRTTVVRISNIESLPLKRIASICKSMGCFRILKPRCRNSLDVHYKTAEWPNMWNILNRLNGVEVDGRRWQAEPAPVFPPDILLALWHQPEGRKILKTTAQALLHKLGKMAVHTSELVSLENILLDKFEILEKWQE